MADENQSKPAEAANTTPESTKPANDKVLGGLISSILDLTGKSQDEVMKKEEPKPAEKPAEKPVEEVKPEPEKIKVRRRAPEPVQQQVQQPSVEEVVQKTIERVLPKAEPKQEKAPEPDETQGLSASEREEYELYQYLEGKDPSKRGLTKKFVEFAKAQREFVAKRAQEEGADYDPSTDPAYKRFLQQHELGVSKEDRRRAYENRLVEQAEQRAYERAQKDLNPKLAELERQQREIREMPVIDRTVSQFRDAVEAEMPQEIMKAFTEVGRDVEKVREIYPEEFDAMTDTLEGATNLAKEALAIRRGVKAFDGSNDAHVFLGRFVDGQARALLSTGDSRILVQNGRQFVHPKDYNPSMAATHWTFSDDHILAMLREQAKREVSTKIQGIQTRQKQILEATRRRTTALSGAGGNSPMAESSPRSAASTPASTNVTPAQPTVNPISAVLGLR